MGFTKKQLSIIESVDKINANLRAAQEMFVLDYKLKITNENVVLLQSFSKEKVAEYDFASFESIYRSFCTNTYIFQAITEYEKTQKEKYC